MKPVQSFTINWNEILSSKSLLLHKLLTSQEENVTDHGRQRDCSGNLFELLKLWFSYVGVVEAAHFSAFLFIYDTCKCFLPILVSK